MKINKENRTKKKIEKNLEKTSKVIKKSKNVPKIKKNEALKVNIQKQNTGKNFKKEKLIVNKNAKFNKTKTWEKTTTNTEGKTDWTKFKKEKKLLKLKRKEGKYKDLSNVIKEAKVIYEKLKCRSSDKKEELSEKLYNLLVKGDCITKFVLAHDTSRIIQCLLRYASSTIKEELTKALIPMSLTMMQSRYARFCIITILKYGSSNSKSKLIESLYGSVIKLCSHNTAGKIMDVIYFEKASKNQKICLRQEFYSDLLTKSKDLKIKHIKDTYTYITQNSKDIVLENIKQKLIHLANKNAMDNSLVHEILLEYIEECNEGKSKEECEEFLKICIPLIPHLLTTRSGTRCATLIFWLSETRERRAIIKSIKDHLQKICLHEHGYRFILAIINSLDDTKAIKKSIFDPMMTFFDEIISNQYGRKILLWFIVPADNKIFPNDLIKFLQDGLIHSKKIQSVRTKEIFEQIEQPLCDKINENPQLWVSNGNIGLLTAAFLKQISVGKCSEIFESLTKEITLPTWKIQDSEDLGIEDSGMHHVIKIILKQDRAKIEKGELSFAEKLLENISEKTLNLWISKNRGCFVLVLLFETLNETKQKELKKILMSHIKTLETTTHKGAQILCEKIKNI